jgi:hypothetical protein
VPVDVERTVTGSEQPQYWRVIVEHVAVEHVEPTPSGLAEQLVRDVLRESDGLTETKDKFSITRTDDGAYSVRRVFDPIARHEAFHNLVLNPKILDVVENPIGPNIQLHHTKLNMKPPSSREARFEWHQDYPFFPAHQLRSARGHDTSMIRPRKTAA